MKQKWYKEIGIQNQRAIKQQGYEATGVSTKRGYKAIQSNRNAKLQV
jgi:hypothetical protein